MKYFILLLLVFGAAANHAKTIEEVIVKADLRQASTMHLASSLTVISEDVIQARAAQHFEDIIQAIQRNYAGRQQSGPILSDSRHWRTQPVY